MVHIVYSPPWYDNLLSVQFSTEYLQGNIEYQANMIKKDIKEKKKFLIKILYTML